MESETYATDELQKKAGVFNENRKNCRHVGNAFNDMFTCVPCDSLRREVQAFNVVEVDRLLSSGSADAMCVGEDGSHVLYLLLRQSIRESDTVGGDFAALDELKTETARSLLKHGADIACLDPIKHPDWHNDLCECIEHGETAFVSLMLSSGYSFQFLSKPAILVACTEQNITVLTSLLSSRANVNESRRSSFHGRSAIQICIRGAWLPGVSLLKSSALLEQTDLDGFTALDHAVHLLSYTPDKPCAIHIFKLLLQSGASVTKRIKHLLLASQTGHSDFLDYVLMCTNAIDHINAQFDRVHRDSTPLFLALRNKEREKFKVLLKHGADTSDIEFVLSERVLSWEDDPEISNPLRDMRTFLTAVQVESNLRLADFVQRALRIHFPIAQLFMKNPKNTNVGLHVLMNEAVT
jgi:hypothetical protein